MCSENCQFISLKKCRIFRGHLFSTYPKVSENYYFLAPKMYTYVGISGVKKCSDSKNFANILNGSFLTVMSKRLKDIPKFDGPYFNKNLYHFRNLPAINCISQ